MSTGSASSAPAAPPDLRLGLNLAFLVPGESGGRETYARELTTTIADLRPELEITSFVNRETADADGFWREAGRVVRMPVSARSRTAWAWGETVAVRVAAARAGIDVLHSPANFGPTGGAFARVLTLHDVLFRSHPELVPLAGRLGTEALLPRAARRADRVITVSQAARAEIEARLHVDAARIEVIPNGVAAPAGGDRTAGRRLAGAGERPVALSVASHLPHKNLAALLAGLAVMDPAERPVLVLAGHGTDAPELASAASELGVHEDVRSLGAVSPAQLEDLYSAAAVAVSATRHEGFGLPVLEAMARGVPVACPDLPVLREVAGTEVLWLDPGDPRSVAAALRRALSGGAAIDGLRAAGRERAGRFTWRAAAERTLEVYDAALAERRG
jgi:glycosyltransferase involved in cell wall biosynthesis